jgi:hypothetical protein
MFSPFDFFQTLEARGGIEPLNAALCSSFATRFLLTKNTKPTGHSLWRWVRKSFELDRTLDD